MNDYERASARSWAFGHAKEVMKRQDPDEILEYAKKISGFFEGKDGATVSIINKNEDKKC